jgi:hypothetical protein
MMPSRHPRLLAVWTALSAAIVLACSACSGSRSAALVPPRAAPAGAAKSTLVTFAITVPLRTSANRRSPRYVSASTQSASVTVAPSGGSPGTPVVVNCTTTCTGQIAAPVGSDTFTMKLFDAQNASGNLLSTGTLTQTIVIDQANSVNVTFNGVVASLSVALSPSAVTSGGPTTVAVSFAALDAAKNAIVGPGVYVDANGNPVTVQLADSDTSGATKLSATTFSEPPTAPITLSYNGAPTANPVITASAAAVPSAAATLAINASCSGTAGSLYVANVSNVLVFDPAASGNVAPVRAISMPSGHSALDVAVAADGTAYVAVTQNGFTPSVDVFAPCANGAVAPIRSFSDTQAGSTSVVRIRLDPAGNPTINFNGRIDTLPASSNGAVAPTRSILTGPAVTGMGGLPALQLLWGKPAFDPAGNLWVSDTDRDAIKGYAPSASGSAAPFATVSGDLSAAHSCTNGIAADSGGSLYTTSAGNGCSRATYTGIAGVPPSIQVFAPGTGEYGVARIITGAATGLTDPQTIAVDGAGNIYVVNGDAQTGFHQRVLVFAAGASGNVAPVRTITSSAVSPNGGVTGIGVDALGEIALASRPVPFPSAPDGSAAGIFVFDPAAGANATPVRTITGPATTIAPTDAKTPLAVDAAGNAYLRERTSSGPQLLRFAPGANGNVAPASSTSLNPSTGEGNATLGVAVDGAGRAYVAAGTQSVDVYDTTTSSAQFIKTINPTTAGITVSADGGLALAPSSVLAVNTEDEILTYDAGGSGLTAPVRRLRGGAVGPFGPQDVDFDASGNLYVYTWNDGTVHVYGPHASGNATPVRVIQNIQPNLFNAFSGNLAVDGTGKVYVNGWDQTTGAVQIAVYAAGANGLATPARVIKGAQTMLANPVGLGFGP